MTKKKISKKTYFEFFAGGGMARLGLGEAWSCLFANDFDSQKAAAYRENFGSEHFCEGDVAALVPTDLPAAKPDLVWSSFPCQDLSLAGERRGLAGRRSSIFHAFWSLMKDLAAEGRAPTTIVLENVTGLLTSNDRRDIQSIIVALADEGYAVSALVLDAARFVPQSRKRVFIFGLPYTADFAQTPPPPSDETPQALIDAVHGLPPRTIAAWRWLDARPRQGRNIALADLLDEKADRWHTPEQTARLVNAMSARQRAALEKRRGDGCDHVGAAFKRIRVENGEKTMRVEARFDGIAGCLRTPAGGSSRQIILAISNGDVRSRLLTPREAARLMGVPDNYRLPNGATAALKLCGDGVATPVVRWIAETILTPALAEQAAAA